MLNRILFALDIPGEVDDTAWHDAQSSLPKGPTSPTFNEYMELCNEILTHEMFYFDTLTFDTEAELEDIVDACIIHSSLHLINNTTTFKQAPEYAKMQPFFSWLPVKVIKKTFESTTQYARTPASAVLYKYYKAPCPALNMLRRDEPVAIDTVYCNTPAIDDRVTSM